MDVSKVTDPGFQPFTLGRYRVFMPLGLGGMGKVFLAEQTGVQGFSKVVVIKVMHEEQLQNPRLVNMFVDEARVMSALDHPNVVRILDLQQDDKRLYMALEHVDGLDLNRLMHALHERQEKLSVNLVLHVVCAVLAGLDHAHEATGLDEEPLELVHRDVTPANILLGRSGHVKLSDFGVARARGRLSETVAGEVKGKLHSLAPEVLQGARATAQADIFSTGVLLWEALTGDRLFDGKSDFHVMEAVLRRPVPPPSTYNAEIPAGLDQVLLAALERDPQKRIATARAFRHELLRFTPAEDMDVHQRELAELVARHAPPRRDMARARLRALEALEKVTGRKAVEDPPDSDLDLDMDIEAALAPIQSGAPGRANTPKAQPAAGRSTPPVQPIRASTPRHGVKSAAPAPVPVFGETPAVPAPTSRPPPPAGSAPGAAPSAVPGLSPSTPPPAPPSPPPPPPITGSFTASAAMPPPPGSPFGAPPPPGPSTSPRLPPLGGMGAAVTKPLTLDALGSSAGLAMGVALPPLGPVAVGGDAPRINPSTLTRVGPFGPQPPRSATVAIPAAAPAPAAAPLSSSPLLVPPGPGETGFVLANGAQFVGPVSPAGLLSMLSRLDRVEGLAVGVSPESMVSAADVAERLMLDHLVRPRWLAPLATGSQTLAQVGVGRMLSSATVNRLTGVLLLQPEGAMLPSAAFFQEGCLQYVHDPQAGEHLVTLYQRHQPPGTNLGQMLMAVLGGMRIDKVLERMGGITPEQVRAAISSLSRDRLVASMRDARTRFAFHAAVASPYALPRSQERVLSVLPRLLDAVSTPAEVVSMALGLLELPLQLSVPDPQVLVDLEVSQEIPVVSEMLSALDPRYAWESAAQDGSPQQLKLARALVLLEQCGFLA